MVGFITQRFGWFIVGYFALQVIIRLLTTHIAVLDESEQIMLTQYFSWGYNEQPPLYTWIQMGVFKLTGISIFGLSLLKNTLLCMSYLCVYNLGILFTEDKLKSSLGALSLFLLPQMVWDAQVDQTHTVFLTTATLISVYLFFYIVKKEATLWHFVLFGLISGVGLLAKYNFVLVLIALGFVALWLPQYRKKFYVRYLLLSASVAFCMVLPHFVWFITHLDVATHRTVERMNVGHTSNMMMNFAKGSGDLMLSFVAFLSPFWLIFLGFFRKNFTWYQSDEAKALLGYVGIIFIFLFVMVALSGTTHIKERWLQPYLVLVPLFLFLHISVSSTDTIIKRYSFVALIAPIIVALVVLIRPWLIDFRGKPTRASYPFEQLSTQIHEKIAVGTKTLIYAEDKYIGGNMKLFLPYADVITPSLPNQPYALTQTVVVLWETLQPVSFLQSLAEHYTCTDYKDTLHFQHSKKLTYTVNYKICSRNN
ncbi:MAG: glycosyltransferase family 39 protein [Sulfurospirillaceae bacterium]|nr:glycosyltransferase family 39 protein [Sulfurospirillaceae bacterium]